MKDILDQMEEHIAEIRNLQRNFDFHSKRLEALMTRLSQMETDPGAEKGSVTVESSDLPLAGTCPLTPPCRRGQGAQYE